MKISSKCNVELIIFQERTQSTMPLTGLRLASQTRLNLQNITEQVMKTMDSHSMYYFFESDSFYIYRLSQTNCPYDAPSELIAIGGQLMNICVNLIQVIQISINLNPVPFSNSEGVL